MQLKTAVIITNSYTAYLRRVSLLLRKTYLINFFFLQSESELQPYLSQIKPSLVLSDSEN